MPVITRSQKKIMCAQIVTQKIKTTLEEPVILQVIVSNLKENDLINMRFLSKDERYTEVINDKLNELKEKKMKNKIVIDKIKNYLHLIEITKDCNKQIQIINQNFEFLSENMWFLEEHKRLIDVVHNKIVQLMYKHSKWQNDGVGFLIKMFNVKPPRDYYDSETGLTKYGLYDVHNNFVELYKYPHLESYYNSFFVPFSFQN